MSDNHDVQQTVRRHLMIFAALLVLTFITVGASYVHISNTAGTIAFALAVAVVEAVLVAGFMMHLVTERKIVHVILVPTVFFFVVLMYLILWATSDGSRLHIH